MLATSAPSNDLNIIRKILNECKNRRQIDLEEEEEYPYFRDFDEPDPSDERKFFLLEHLQRYTNAELRDLVVYGYFNICMFDEIPVLTTKFILNLSMGASQRCKEMIDALISMFDYHRAPADVPLRGHWEYYLKAQMRYMQMGTTICPMIENLLSAIYNWIMNMDVNWTEKQAKEKIISYIRGFKINRIQMAQHLILERALTLIHENDVILTIGYSSQVVKLFTTARKSGINFQVVLVEARPLLEGRHCIQLLMDGGIQGYYCFLSGLRYLLPRVTKTIIGATGFYTNGNMLARVGTSMLCLLSKQYNKPVIALSETLKFSHRALMDSFCVNEMSDPSKLTRAHWNPNKKNQYLENWRNMSNLTISNPIYDVTPAELIDLIVSEVGIVPTTSVSTILHRYC